MNNLFLRTKYLHQLLTVLLFVILPFSIILGNALININLVLIIILSFFNIEKKLIKNFLNIIFLIACVWFVYLIICSAISNYPMNSLKSSISYLRFPFFSFAIYFLCKSNIKVYNYFFISLFTSFIFIVFYAYFQNIYKINLFGDLVTHRLYLFRDEEILGSYLSRLLPILIGLFFYVKKELKFFDFVFLSIFIFIVGSAITLSGERTAVFIFFMTVIFLILFLQIDKKSKLILIAPFLITIILIFSIQSIKKNIIDKTYDQIFIKHADKFHDANTKIDFIIDNKYFDMFSLEHEWHAIAALKIINNNFLVGVGPKNFRVECKDIKYNIINGCSTHPHNTLLQLLTEIGLIGTLPVIILFLYICFIFFKSLLIKIDLRNSKIHNFKFLLFFCIFVSLLPVIPSGNFFGTWLSTITFLSFGLILTINNNE